MRFRNWAKREQWHLSRKSSPKIAPCSNRSHRQELVRASKETRRKEKKEEEEKKVKVRENGIRTDEKEGMKETLRPPFGPRK